MTMNGSLAGLAAITAGTAFVSPTSAVFIGMVAGILVVLAVNFFDKMLVDDPVGAIAVHGVNGVWGIIAVGLFAEKGGLFYGGGFHLLAVQFFGVLVISLWAFTTTYAIFTLLKKTMGIRVTVEEELDGLDISEHGISAYSGLLNTNNEGS
jgi:Amt family ammonium transporter